MPQRLDFPRELNEQFAVKRTDLPMNRTDPRRAASPQHAWPCILPNMGRRRRYFLLHCAGWAIFSILLFVSALPWLKSMGGIQMMIYRAVYLPCAFLCSFPLWALCRALWRREWPLAHAMGLAALCCLPLGYLCAIAGELSIRSFSREPSSWPEMLFDALSSTSAIFALIIWCGLYFGFKQYERVTRVETLVREAELRALRYQLTPHFLCNTLNGISTLVGEGRTQDARRMIARLGDFLRTTLEGVGSLEVPLAQEVHFLEQYLAIEQARLGDRLAVEVQIAPETLDAQVPNLLLQPLVENAIQHGITPFPAGGSVAIRAKRAGDQVNVLIQNRSHGEHAVEASGEPPSAVSHRHGFGLKNIEDRLRASYGERGSVALRQLDAGAWEVAVALPYRTNSNGNGNGNGSRNGHAEGLAG